MTGYEAWRKVRGYDSERADGLTVDPEHPPRFVNPAAESAHNANRDAEKAMLHALYNWRYLVYQRDEKAARAAFVLFRERCRDFHEAARKLIDATTVPVRQRPRSKDE